MAAVVEVGAAAERRVGRVRRAGGEGRRIIGRVVVLEKSWSRPWRRRSNKGRRAGLGECWHRGGLVKLAAEVSPSGTFEWIYPGYFFPHFWRTREAVRVPVSITRSRCRVARCRKPVRKLKRRIRMACPCARTNLPETGESWSLICALDGC